MRVVPFEKGHFDRIRLRTEDAGSRDIYFGHVEQLAASGPAWAGMTDAGHIVAIAGVFQMWPGVGEAWVVGGDLLRKHRLFFHREVRRHLRQIWEDGEFRRIQAIVRDGIPQSHPWVKRLGFIEEGVLRGYAPNGDDCTIYAMVRK